MGRDPEPLLYGLEQPRSRLQYRILPLAVLALLVLFLLLARLFDLQLLQGQTYREKARNNRIHTQPILAPRGNVYDRNGKVLATNKESHSILFDPRRLSNSQIYQTLQTLAQYLDISYPDLRKQLDFENLQPVYLYHDLSSEELALVLEHKERLPGVEVSTSLERHYPVNELMVHFLGHMGQINAEELKQPEYRNYYPGTLIGKNGLERIYEPFLKGQDGKEIQEIHLRNSTAADEEASPPEVMAPVPGSHLQLTIDKDLQAYCYHLLAEHHVAGAIVVMDPNTGALRALASFPAYNPNLFNKGLTHQQWDRLQNDPLHPFLDRATNAYAPGSIFKIVTTLAGLGTGHLTPQRSFNSTGHLKVAGHIFYDWNHAGFGAVNIYQALAYSIDTVYYQLAQEMGMEPIRDYARRFGLGSETGIELPSEGKGIVPDPAWKKKYIKADWLPGDTVNASIGQGYVQMTPLQATRMVAAVATRGKLVVPHLVTSIGRQSDSHLEPRSDLKPQQIQGIPPENWRVVQQGLEDAVSYGTVHAMKMPDVHVAAKTGTAETVPGKANHAWVVAYAPAEQPRYAMTVFLEHGGSGGGRAAPLGRKVMDYLFGRKP